LSPWTAAATEGAEITIAGSIGATGENRETTVEVRIA
jgi:hypothetical protein